MSGRATRFNQTSDVVTNPQNTSDGFGGLKKGAGTIVVAGFRFMAWDMGAYQRNLFITQRGLNADSDLKKIDADYNALIDEGHFLTIDGATYRLLSVTKINGGDGQPVALSGIAHKSK